MRRTAGGGCLSDVVGPDEHFREDDPILADLLDCRTMGFCGIDRAAE